MFAYFHESENGAISSNSLHQNIYIAINCGSFSYAEIPRQFDYIMGVTGTLRVLSKPEREVIQKDYKILKETYMPSVFGKNNLLFNTERDIRIETSDDYLNAISTEIEQRIKGKL